MQVMVTVPPLGGAFNNVVTLSASGLPRGATATFNPPTVTPGAEGEQTQMTIQLVQPGQQAGGGRGICGLAGSFGGGLAHGSGVCSRIVLCGRAAAPTGAGASANRDGVAAGRERILCSGAGDERLQRRIRGVEHAEGKLRGDGDGHERIAARVDDGDGGGAMSGRAMAGENMPMNARKQLRAVMMLMLAMGAATALARPSAAQSSAPKFRIWRGLQFCSGERAAANVRVFFDERRQRLDRLRAWERIEVWPESSAVSTRGDINGSGEDLTLVSYLFGPKYSWRASERWQPFGQVLLGGAHASGTFEPSVKGGSGSYNSFAMIAGGGMDIAASEHLAVRAVEADYYLTQFPNGVNGRQNNFRISAGVIFRF